MKLLIAYDGSRCSEAALDDLQKAGLPDNCEVLILSVAEAWFQTLAEPSGFDNFADSPESSSRQTEMSEDNGGVIFESETFAHHAQKRLQTKFPWQISARTSFGSPAKEILKCAAEFQPDLIVVGSHGRSAVSRFLLGSISHKVLTEAACPVRVARGRIEVDPFPVRIIIGFDGSDGAKSAVEAVAKRHWREHSEFRLVTATDLIVPTAIGRFVPPVADWASEKMKSNRKWIERLAETELRKLRDAGLDASIRDYPGNPKSILVEEAQKWNADCIFVGANSAGKSIARFLLGSTAAAVAERANCSVEVVRN